MADVKNTGEDGTSWRQINRGKGRVVVWDATPSPYNTGSPVTICGDMRGWRYVWDRLHPEHLAFVLGDMPGYVYADWLEETIPNEVPAELLALLRMPVTSTH